MKRPLLIVAISYTIGVIIGVYFKISILFILPIGILFTIILKNKQKAKIVLIIIITVTTSFLRTEHLNRKYEKMYRLDKQNITVIGTICETIKTTEYKYAVTIKLNNTYKNTKLIIYIDKKQENQSLKYGNQIIVTGLYKKPTESRNYKGYNNKQNLKAKGISGTITAEKTQVTKKKNINILLICINNISEKFKRNLEKLLDEETAGLAKGILLGDNSNLDTNIKEDFKTCNLSHMLAVSGTHLSYIVLGINLIFRKKIFGIQNSKIISIVLIIIFIIIVNMMPSVVRAGLSTIIMIASTLIHRKQDTYTTMSIALLATLIINPFSLFNIGLQLSYLASLSIIIFYKKINNREDNKIKKFIKDNIKLTVSANILILPIIIYNFNIIPLNAILSNFICAPILGIFIILGLFTLIISLISLKISKILAIPLNLISKLLIKVTNIISKIPLGNLIVITPYIITVMVSYLLIFSCLNKKKKLTKVLMFCLVLIIIVGRVIDNTNIKKELSIHFIDVGQGDCCLIRTPENKKILIDGGGSRDYEKYDIGEKVLVPYLLDRRIKKLDYIIVSHFDADHAQGLEKVIEKINVKNIIISKQASESSEYNKIITLCNKNKVNIIVVKRGQKIAIDKYVYFNILHPGDKLLDDGKGGLNANAIVMKLYYKTKKQEFTMLFTGDIEETSEQELTKIYGNKLKADVLKVAHHGSKTSSTENFLKQVLPNIALIGVGEENKFGHPNEMVLKRLQEINCKVYRTDKNGEISIKVNLKRVIKLKSMYS